MLIVCHLYQKVRVNIDTMYCQLLVAYGNTVIYCVTKWLVYVLIRVLVCGPVLAFWGLMIEQLDASFVPNASLKEGSRRTKITRQIKF